MVIVNVRSRVGAVVAGALLDFDDANAGVNARLDVGCRCRGAILMIVTEAKGGQCKLSEVIQLELPGASRNSHITLNLGAGDRVVISNIIPFRCPEQFVGGYYDSNIVQCCLMRTGGRCRARCRNEIGPWLEGNGVAAAGDVAAGIHKFIVV